MEFEGLIKSHVQRIKTLKNDISKNLCYTMAIANFTRKGYYEKERIL